MISQVLDQFSGELSKFAPYATIEDRGAWRNLDQEWREETVNLAESFLGYQWPYLSATDFMDFTRTGNRIRFETPFFSKRQALSALVLAECVEDRGRFLDDIINGIYAVCDESAWNLPAHNCYKTWGMFNLLPDLTRPVIDLFACETGAVMATVAYLLESVLNQVDASITKRIRYELKRRIYTPYLNDCLSWMGSGDPNGNTVLNNWTPWCTQNILISAFLNEECQEDWAKILQKACASIDEFLNGYADDGCCDEGAQYYHHAGLCVSGASQVCNAVTKNAFAKLYEEPKIRNMASYIYHTHVDDIYFVNFADCSPVAGRSGTREYLFAKNTQKPEMMAFVAADFQKGMPDTLTMPQEHNLFYRLLNGFTVTEIKKYAGQETAAQNVYYPSSGLMIVRDDRLFLAAKAGDNGDSHNHNDVGSFTVYKDGKPLLIDVGVETYSKKTFSPQRYEIWTMQSSYHNLPEINGYMQQPGEKYSATNVFCNPEECTLEMDIAGAYPKESGIRSYRRKAVLINGAEIRIEDDFAWEESFDEISGNKVILNLMTYEKPIAMQADASGKQRILVGEEGKSEGAAGCLILENAHVSSIETIPIDDPRLQIAWKHDIYRIQVKPDKNSFLLRVLR